MNVFDIIGPVMIGPSSSHTAGAVRIGRVANKLMDGKKPASLEITLSGSFARTYREHGTDRALLAGIMGYHSWSEEIRDALKDPVALIVDAVRTTLNRCEPELAADLVDRGLVLSGGSSQLKGLDKLLAEQTGLPSAWRTIRFPRSPKARVSS